MRTGTGIIGGRKRAAVLEPIRGCGACNFFFPVVSRSEREVGGAPAHAADKLARVSGGSRGAMLLVRLGEQVVVWRLSPKFVGGGPRSTCLSIAAAAAVTLPCTWPRDSAIEADSVANVRDPSR